MMTESEMDLQLENRTALVTGATAGIGLAIAERLAQEGADLVICGRAQAKLDEAVDAVMANRPSGSARGVLADPATAEGAALLARELPEVDILVDNLGVYESKPFGEITDEDWRHIFEVNVLSGARLARQYLPGMLRRNFGRIIFISSDSALMVPPDMIHYAMTKTAQLTISRGLAELTRGTAVTVNAVQPGTTRSAGIVDFMKSVVSDPNAPPEQIEAEFFEKQRPTSLIQRMIDPTEVANIVAFVASPLASATNGAALRADGGIVPTIA